MEQAQFEAEMERFETVRNHQLERSFAEVENELTKCRRQLESYTESTIELQREGESEFLDAEKNAEAADLAIIRELQAVVEQRNSERYQNLERSKEKLSQCIETLDEIDRAQAVQVGNRRITINDIDQRYESELVKLEKGRAAMKARLAAKLADVTRRAQTLTKAARHLERTNQRQMGETVNALEMLKSRSLVRADESVVRPDDLAKVEAQQATLEKLAKVRDGKNQSLNRARTTNLDLKRQIWRTRHDLRFSGVMQAGSSDPGLNPWGKLA
jgi:hypothetical protein